MSSLMSPKATGGGSDTLAGSLGACLSWAADQSQLRVWQPGSLPLPLPTPGMLQRPGGGGRGCLEDQLPWGGMVLIGSCFPRDPAPPFQGLPAKAPGCLGTFPNKYARAASLSGKHGLPLPPPCYHHPCQLCLVGTLWGQRMAWESGHLGPNSILETQDLGQVSVHPEPASSMYWDAPPSWRTRWEG